MPQRTCSVPACDRPFDARGFCNAHYLWHRKHGLLANVVRPTASEYAAKYIELDAASGCWAWIGPPASQGYGFANHNGVRSMAHRFVYQLYRGDIPDGLVLDHLCRNRICVNPDHLEPVTHAENLHRGEGETFVAHRSGVCLKGHELTPDNLYVDPNGTRRCVICCRANRAEAYQRRKRENGIPDRKVKGTCKEPDCTRDHAARGMCALHYWRWRKAEATA